MKQKNSGNCYAASEALYHILGGKEAGWKPKVLKLEEGTHWFLEHKSGMILDVSRFQFSKLPDYTKAKGCGFLTKKPSKKALDLIGKLTWK